MRAYNYKKKMVSRFISEQEHPLDLSYKTELYYCPDCGGPFDNLDRLKAHLRRHRIKESGRYTCTVCQKKFVQQSSLITHMRIHTGERPYKCEICKKTYGDLSTFTKHQRIHTGEKPYYCYFCPRHFSQSGNCLRHMRSVHKKFKLPKSWAKSLKQRQPRQPKSGSSSSSSMIDSPQPPSTNSPCYSASPSDLSSTSVVY